MTFRPQTLVLLFPLILSACGASADVPAPANTPVSDGAQEVPAKEGTEPIPAGDDA